MTDRRSEPGFEELATIMRGILAMLIADRDERIGGNQAPRRAEAVLADAGLALVDIAALTGRNYDSVKGVVRRARVRPAEGLKTAVRTNGTVKAKPATKGSSNGEDDHAV